MVLAGAVGEAGEVGDRGQPDAPRDRGDEGGLEAELLPGDGGDLLRQEERHPVHGDLDAEVDRAEVPDSHVTQGGQPVLGPVTLVLGGVLRRDRVVQRRLRRAARSVTT